MQNSHNDNNKVGKNRSKLLQLKKFYLKNRCALTTTMAKLKRSTTPSVGKDGA